MEARTAWLLLHLLGAAIWTGGHLVLALTVLPRALHRREPGIVLSFEEGFERLALPALFLQILSGLFLLHGRLPVTRWLAFGSPEETLAGVKLLALALTLGLALHARFRVLPGAGETRLRSMAWHIAAVTLLSVLLLVAGGLLTAAV